MQPSDEQPIRPTIAARALVLLRSAVAAYATVETTGDPTVVALCPTELASHHAQVSLLQLRARFTGHTHDRQDNLPVVIVGQRLSAARRDIREGMAHNVVGCIDLAGIVTLRLPGLFIDRSDLKAKAAHVPSAAFVSSTTDPFADRSSLVCRTLIAHATPTSGWHTRELARTTGLAVSRVSAVLNELVARGICRREADGARKRLVTNRRALFEAWTSAYRWTDNTTLTVAAPVGDVDRFTHTLQRLVPTGVDWALTLTAGAARVAPHAPVDKIHCYMRSALPDALSDVQRDVHTPLSTLKDIASVCKWPEASDGRLVLLAPHYRMSVWHDMRRQHGINVVSDLQLALDCWFYPVRGREQAEHLLSAHHLLTDDWR